MNEMPSPLLYGIMISLPLKVVDKDPHQCKSFKNSFQRRTHFFVDGKPFRRSNILLEKVRPPLTTLDALDNIPQIRCSCLIVAHVFPWKNRNSVIIASIFCGGKDIDIELESNSIPN